MNPQAPRLLILLLVAMCHSVVAQNEDLFSPVNEADLGSDQSANLARLRSRPTTAAD